MWRSRNPVDPRDGISIEQLEKLINHKRVAFKALIVNPNVHNPLGGIMPDENTRRIAKVMRDSTHTYVGYAERIVTS